MLNSAILMGRPTTDIEPKVTPNGVSVCSFSLAVDRDYKSKSGEKQTDFITITCWRGTADFAAKYVKKGQLIAVQGSIQTRKYTDRDGNKRTAFEVVADNVHFAEPKRDSSNNNSYHAAEKTLDVSAGNDDFEELPDDGDLPF